VPAPRKCEVIESAIADMVGFMPRPILVALLVSVAGCASHRQPSTVLEEAEAESAEDARLDNLHRAARYPWKDDGHCVVREASSDWAVLVERCFDALDLARIRFDDRQGACPVAQVGAIPANEALRLVGICLLVQPELAVGAVIVIGAIIVAAAIIAEIEAAEARRPCTCFCAAPGVFLGDGSVKVKDKAACQQYCSATYPKLNPTAVCR
jgi:hypothetical protein